MEAYRRKVQRKIWVSGVIGGLIALAFIAAKLSGLLTKPAGDGAAFLTGFQVGMFIGFEGILIFYLVHSVLLLRNPEKLEENKIKENDEREKVIALHSCKTTVLSLIMIISLALVVSCSFSFAVMATLLAVYAALLLVYFGTTAFYSKKL